MPTFAERVYSILAEIPRGRVISYTQLASLAGSPRAARAVGTVLRKNTRPAHLNLLDSLPCHRVVLSNGQLGQYNGGVRRKCELLLNEGVVVVNGRVDSKFFWNKI